MVKESNQISNREVKASAFTAYFSDPKKAAELYMALTGEQVAPRDIHYTTLKGVLFLVRKNDLAFTVKDKVLVISEHQSTINDNMPLRSAIYYGRTMEKLIEPRALYRTNRIPIPTPEFFTFYNGNAEFPPEKILKLSDAYIEKTDEPMLELTIRVININLPVNHPMLEQCRPLYEYSWFIQKIKEYIGSGNSRDEAIIHAMGDCRAEGIMVEFLNEHGTEAVNMLFTEFNMEDALDVRYEEGIAKGWETGRMTTLIGQARKKLKKDISVEETAELLEENVQIISRIYEALQRYPEKNDADICAMLQAGQN